MKSTWSQKIRQKLTCAKRIVILGIGNVQKGDDGAGAICADLLRAWYQKKHPDNLKIINGGDMPENYTSDIRKFKPSHVIIVDACCAEKKPGTIFLVDPTKITDEDISTHRMPLAMLIKFLEETIGCRTITIGIEPKSLAWTSNVSTPVQKAITRFANNLIRLFQK